MKNGLLLLLYVFILIPGSVIAHGSETSFEAQMEKGIIDIGYSPETFQAGEKIVLEFDMRTQALPNGERIDFDRVWVRMRNGENTYFASGIAKSVIGPTTLSLTLPHEAAGKMTLTVRFEKEEVSIGEAEFEVDIKEAKIAHDYRECLPQVLGGLLLPFIVVFTYQTMRRKLF